MQSNIFNEVKSIIDARNVVSKILGEPAKISGENYFWNSPFNSGDNDPSFCVKADMISDFSTDETGQDIFNFIVNYNNNIKSIVSDKEINNHQALKWIVNEFHLDIDITSYSKNPVSNDFTNTATTIKKYHLETAKTNHINDNGIYAMFDTEYFQQKPQGDEIGKIKNRIPKLSPDLYTLQQIKNNIITGYTCIPGAIKSEKDWKDDESFYQIFMVDIDNVESENGVKQKYTIDDEKHVTVDKILEYCASINLIPTFIYYTFSHTEQQHKFRLVYILDIATSNMNAVKGIYDFLKDIFKNYNIDTAPTNIASLFLGGQSIAFESNTLYDIETIEETIEVVENGLIESLANTCNKHLQNSNYRVGNGKLWIVKKDNEFQPISNFVAYPAEKINYINGKDTQTIYFISGHLLDEPDLELPTLKIDVDTYAKGNFILGSAWDKWAIVSAGRSNTDRLREVMQILGRTITEEKNVYAHTGFRRIDDKLCFLYHNGVIGNVENIDADLSMDDLQQYHLTDKEFDLEQAQKRSLSFIDLADYKITIPILSTVYLSPLTTILAKHNIHADFILFVQGKSGSKKSSVTAVALSHFGKFDRDTFPCSFRNTLNSIEKKAYILKDVVNVVDDYNPEVAGNKKLEIMEKLYAMYGDRVGRTRMSQDGKTLKAGYTARGLCIVTGEMLPDVAQSRIARSLIVTIKEDSIDLNKLSELQDNSEELAFCMKEYIGWIIDNEERIIEYAKSLFKEIRINQNKANHGRTNEISAVVNIGFTLFTQFLLEYNVIDSYRKQCLDRQAISVLKDLVEEQTQEITELKPSELFYDIFEQLLATHEISVKNIATGFSMESGNGIAKEVGYYDEKRQRYYLFPDAIYNAVDRYYSNYSNKRFPVNAKTLWRYLAEDGYLHQNDKKRFKVAKRICGQTVHVIDILAKEIDFSEITESIGTEPGKFSYWTIPRFGTTENNEGYEPRRPRTTDVI